MAILICSTLLAEILCGSRQVAAYNEKATTAFMFDLIIFFMSAFSAILTEDKIKMDSRLNEVILLSQKDTYWLSAETRYRALG